MILVFLKEGKKFIITKLAISSLKTCGEVNFSEKVTYSFVKGENPSVSTFTADVTRLERKATPAPSHPSAAPAAR